MNAGASEQGRKVNYATYVKNIMPDTHKASVVRMW